MLTVNLRRPPAWKTLYELQAATLLLFAGFMPVVGIVVALFGSLFLIPAAALYGGVLLFVQRRAIDWKCPRCGKPFLRSNGAGFAVPFRRRCGTCKLQRGAGAREIYGI